MSILSRLADWQQIATTIWLDTPSPCGPDFRDGIAQASRRIFRRYLLTRDHNILHLADQLTIESETLADAPPTLNTRIAGLFGQPQPVNIDGHTAGRRRAYKSAAAAIRQLHSQGQDS